MTIAECTAYAKKIAVGPFGYSQHSSSKDGRLSGLYHTPGNFDCTGACLAVGVRGNMVSSSMLKKSFFSGNMIKQLVSDGLYVAIDISNLSFAKQKAKIREGDYVRGPGHGVYCIGGGKVMSFEKSEHGTTHGKVGDQTGKEGRIRDFYDRGEGWTEIARPISPETLLARAIAGYAKHGNPGRAIDLLARRSAWDGPRWNWFIDQWEALDKGLKLAYTAAELQPPSTSHVFVVLGSSLNPDGSLTKRFQRRLDLAAAAAAMYPATKVLVTGGKAHSGVTEAVAGRNYLMLKGVTTGRIITETRSSSTIGNAMYSLPLLKGFTSYTLISDASHLRRAQIEFLAAQVHYETVKNQKFALVAQKPLAVDDYGTAPVATELPASAKTRLTVGTEVAAMLGLSKQFTAAL